MIIIESTVSPGTIDKFVRPVIKEAGRKPGRDIHLVHAPERIIPGNMIYELENNAWCCVRPSGTEPKIKYYFGVKGDSAADAKEKLAKLKSDIMG